MPSWAMDIAASFHNQGLWNEAPDQLMVNEYEPGQGIGRHIDCQQCFTGTIISFSLGSAWVMDLINKETREKKRRLLEP
jgi:alkylated DNA repair dioxygenase AlkB